ncbi:hypothetical protein J6590_049396 [Homalodisca vitripennis]|nr:hypothetical protein J6590_049396 [Homalodisca vitripennis]
MPHLVSDTRLRKRNFGRESVLSTQPNHMKHAPTATSVLLLLRACCYYFERVDTATSVLLPLRAYCYRYEGVATVTSVLLLLRACCYCYECVATATSVLLPLQGLNPGTCVTSDTVEPSLYIRCSVGFVLPGPSRKINTSFSESCCECCLD